jgi:hypothetical protein
MSKRHFGLRARRIMDNTMARLPDRQLMLALLITTSIWIAVLTWAFGFFFGILG